MQFLLLEDGASKLLLEDGVSRLLLEASTSGGGLDLLGTQLVGADLLGTGTLVSA